VNRLARWLVGLYPGAWRERYEDTWLAIVASMGVCVCAAFAAVVRGLRARRSAGLTP